MKTKEELLAVRDTAKSLGVILLDEQEYNNQLAAKAAEVTRSTALAIETSVFELSGVQKQPNEKYYDYVARVVKAGQEVKSELETIKGKGYDQILQTKDAQLEELRGKVAAKDQEYVAKIDEVKRAYFEKDVKQAFNQAVNTLASRAKKIDGVNVPEIVNMKATLEFSRILAENKPVTDEAGNIVGFVGPDQPADKAYIKRETATGRALDFADFLAPVLKDYIMPPGQRTVQGLGSDGQAAVMNSLLHATPAQVMATMKQSGIDIGSQQGQEFIRKLEKVKKANGIV